MAIIKARFADGFRVHGSDLLQGMGRLVVGRYGVVQEAEFDDATIPKRMNIYENTPNDSSVHITEGKVLIPDSRSAPTSYVEAEIIAGEGEPGLDVPLPAPAGANPYIALLVAYRAPGNSNEAGTDIVDVVVIQGAEAPAPIAPDEDDVLADPQINGSSFVILGAVQVEPGGTIQQADIDQVTYQEVARIDGGAVTATEGRHAYGYISGGTNFVQWTKRYDPDSGAIAYHTSDNPNFGTIWKVFVPPARQIEEALDLGLGGNMHIQLGRGDYTVESDTLLPPYTTINGYGHVTRIFDGAGVVDHVFRPQTGCRISNVQFNAAGNATHGIHVRSDLASVHEFYLENVFFYNYEAYAGRCVFAGNWANLAAGPAHGCNRWQWQEVFALQGNFALPVGSANAYWIQRLGNSRLEVGCQSVGGKGLELDNCINIVVEASLHDNNQQPFCVDIINDSTRITLNGTCDRITFGPNDSRMNASIIV